MRWRRRARDGDGGAFLEGTESSISDFGRSAGDGFAEAWNSSSALDDAEGSQALLQPLEDRRSRRSRDLDRRSRRGVFVFGSIVVLGLAAGIAVRQGAFGSDDDETTAAQLADGELASIGDTRLYTESEGVADSVNATPVDRAFLASPSADPMPVGGPQADPPVFSRFMWAGRAHVAVLMPAFDRDSECVVVSLVADDLRVVDLASYGACASEYEVTGDRAACLDDTIIVLEVWPFDPDAVVERPSVAGVRVRVESTDRTTGSVSSVRGSELLAGELLDDVTTMSGRPGDRIELRVGGRSSSCTLLDRAEVPVQLL